MWKSIFISSNHRNCNWFHMIHYTTYYLVLSNAYMCKYMLRETGRRRVTNKNMCTIWRVYWHMKCQSTRYHMNIYVERDRMRSLHGPLTRYVKLRVVHAPGMPGTFSPPTTSTETASKRFRHASRHVRDACAVIHVGIANSRWRGKRSQHPRRMCNPQFYVSCKRSM